MATMPSTTRRSAFSLKTSTDSPRASRSASWPAQSWPSSCAKRYAARLPVIPVLESVQLAPASAHASYALANFYERHGRREQARAMLAAGASRLGTSSGVAILQGLAASGDY